MDELPESIRAQRRLEGIARARHGIFRRDHVERAGVSNGAFGRMLRRGTVHRLHRATYSYGCPPTSDQATWLAAVDAYGPGAALSGDAAAAAWGISPRRVRRIVVLVPRRRTAVPGTVMRRARSLTEAEVTKRQNIPIVTVERLLVELADEGRDVDELCSLIDEATFRRVIDIDVLRSALVQNRFRRGHRRLAIALERYERGNGGTKSAFEARVLTKVKRVLRVPYECNRRRVLGGKRMKPDLLVPSLGIAIEVDGGGHRRPTRQRDDLERDEAYERAGMTVIRIREASERDDVERALRLVEARQARGIP